MRAPVRRPPLLGHGPVRLGGDQTSPLDADHETGFGVLDGIDERRFGEPAVERSGVDASEGRSDGPARARPEGLEDALLSLTLRIKRLQDAAPGVGRNVGGDGAQLALGSRRCGARSRAGRPTPRGGTPLLDRLLLLGGGDAEAAAIPTYPPSETAGDVCQASSPRARLGREPPSRFLRPRTRSRLASRGGVVLRRVSRSGGYARPAGAPSECAGRV
jgi:hypothetical protein